jgi:hypothetical protein
MIKDGAEYFIANMSIEGGNHSPDYSRREMDGYKAQPIQTNGKYFKFYDGTGNYDPEAMLADIAKRGHTFTEPDQLFFKSSKGHYGAGFIDFHGNQREISAAFFHRIFDQEYASKLKEQARKINEKMEVKR